MPAIAAHFQFAQLAYFGAPQQIKERIDHARALFELGAQGPDLLFYFRPYQKNQISAYGQALHHQSGADFFAPFLDTRACWTAGQTAYLLGVCCHYALDRRCHVLVNQMAPTTAKHFSLESAFDACVLKKYGVKKKRYQMVRIQRADTLSLKLVYPTISLNRLQEAADTMVVANRLLQHRILVERVETLLGKKRAFSTLCLPPEGKENEVLLAPFLQAVGQAVSLMELLLDPKTDQAALALRMPETFEGVIR